MNTQLSGRLKMYAPSGAPYLSPLVVALAVSLLLGAAELSPPSVACARLRRYRTTHKRPLTPARAAANTFRAKQVITRFKGSAPWSISRIAEVKEFYRKRFGRPLPISAYGQTAFHTRCGFNHSRAVDVGVSPDSVFGRELMNFLVGAGFPFIAFRRAVPGSATAPHIHIGPESSRFRSPAPCR